MRMYLNKTKILAMLMMIEEAQGMISGSADGWYDLNKNNPKFYAEIENAIDEMKSQIKANGYDFEKNIRPITG